MNTKQEKPKWLLTERERNLRNRLHSLWACGKITKPQVERLETLDRKYRIEGEILNAIH